MLVFEPKELVEYLNYEIETNKRIKKKRGILRLLSRMYLLKKVRPY